MPFPEQGRGVARVWSFKAATRFLSHRSNARPAAARRYGRHRFATDSQTSPRAIRAKSGASSKAVLRFGAGRKFSPAFARFPLIQDRCSVSRERLVFLGSVCANRQLQAVPAGIEKVD